MKRFTIDGLTREIGDGHLVEILKSTIGGARVLAFVFRSNHVSGFLSTENPDPPIERERKIRHEVAEQVEDTTLRQFLLSVDSNMERITEINSALLDLMAEHFQLPPIRNDDDRGRLQTRFEAYEAEAVVTQRPIWADTPKFKALVRETEKECGQLEGLEKRFLQRLTEVYGFGLKEDRSST